MVVLQKLETIALVLQIALSAAIVFATQHNQVVTVRYLTASQIHVPTRLNALPSILTLTLLAAIPVGHALNAPIACDVAIRMEIVGPGIRA